MRPQLYKSTFTVTCGLSGICVGLGSNILVNGIVSETKNNTILLVSIKLVMVSNMDWNNRDSVTETIAAYLLEDQPISMDSLASSQYDMDRRLTASIRLMEGEAKSTESRLESKIGEL